jgi:transcriptional regulator with XRE-family HTH domain
MTEPHIPERHDLANALRGLRVDAQLSTPALAKKLGWSQSRVSRIDLGKTIATREDVEDWLKATTKPVDSELRRKLMALAERARVSLTDWRRELAPGRVRAQQEMAGLESNVSVIRLFGADVVPGLAQTRPYAGAMFRLGWDITADEDLDAIVDAREARQSVLDAEKRIELLMSEFALRRHLVTGPEQRDQIARLIDLSNRPNVRIGVIPFEADEKVHQYHGYAIYGDPETDDSAIVLTETLTRGLKIRAAEEISAYIKHFAQLDATALHGDKLRAFLQEVAAQVTWS